jgi:anaerobic magnesium-protoporphyrin IX monomethyl ester cyclase
MINDVQHILLANAFFLNNDPKQVDDKFKPYPPLAALYGAGSLLARGYEVSLFDATLAEHIDEFTLTLNQVKPQLLVICEDSFNFLSKMCLSHVRQATMTMIELASTVDIPVVINSSDAADSPQVYLDGGADMVIVGEVEQTLVELVDWYARGAKQNLPAGVRTIIDGKPNTLFKRKNSRELDLLPQPAWHLVDINRYQQAWLNRHGHFGINMVTSRGCPYRCNWCAKPVWGQQYVSHSPEYVVAQIEQICHLARPDHIWFADDIFGMKRGWIERYAELVKEQNLVIPFMIQTRVDLLSQPEVDSLKAAGCQQVWLGVESGSQVIVDAMDKDLDLNQAAKVRNRLQQAQISCGFFIQLGYLGEDVNELNATRDMIINLRPDEIGVSVSYPLPGTEFYRQVKNSLAAKTHWQDSNDLDTVFKSTFDGNFYRLIRDHLHQELTALLAAPNCQQTASYWQHQWSLLLGRADEYRHRLEVLCG